MIIFGTAGHIDHGKTTLIQAITGINADRLPEEKERGMTIDLGFAWLETENGDKIGIIDVPGHENFIRNMIIGMTSVDAFILVVDAKEGWKPQTEEHFQIIRLLNIDYGLIVITKTDLVSPEQSESVRLEIQNKISNLVSLKIPILNFNITEKNNIKQLKEGIKKIYSLVPEKKDIGKPRLFIDRVFDIKGSGTVVTGTLLNGNFYQNQQAHIFPGNKKIRLRKLQSYGLPVEKAIIGSRVAINVSGVEKEEINRGDLIYGYPKYQSSRIIDVEVEILPKKEPNSIKNGSEIDFIAHTRILRGRVVFSKGTLKSGEKSYAQIRFLEPISLFLGDYFIIRLPGLNETAGGGRVLNPQASKHSFNKALWNDWLDKRRNFNICEIILTELQKNRTIKKDEFLVNSPYSNLEIEKVTAELKDKNLLFLYANWIVDKRFWLEQVQYALDSIDKMHQDYPFKAGFPVIQLRNSFANLNDDLFNILIEYLAQKNKIKIKNGEIALFHHSVELSKQQESIIKKIVEYIEKDPLNLPGKKNLEEKFLDYQDIIEYLIKRNEIILLEDEILITPKIYNTMKEKIINYLKKNGSITIGEVRNLLHISRKYIVPLLTKMDEDSITRRKENIRVLKN